jgi:hypothetical protein
MEMGHGLASCVAAIHPNVVASRRKLLLNQLLTMPQHYGQVLLFGWRQGKVVRTHGVRDNERVPG